jgi:hypothetical protein
MAANGISTLATKELRQIAKLNLAAAKRGESVDRDLLPTKYVGNNVVNNPNPGGLQTHRPWSSTPPTTFSVVPRNSTVNEGGNITVDITTTNFPDGDVYFTVSGVSASDIAGGVLPSGSTTVNSGVSAVSFNMADDLTTEGTETLVFEVRTGSTSGPIVASCNVTINDTSTTPDYLIMNLDGTNPGGIGITANANSTGQDGNGYYITINGNYGPYLPILSADNTWTVSGGPNNLVNVPVVNVVPNFQNITPLYAAVYIGNNNPGNNTAPFTFAPAVQTWNDQTTYGNNGTLINGPTYIQSFGGYFAFDGSNDCISLPVNFIDWTNTPLTVSIWYRTSVPGVILGQTNSATPGAGTGWVPAIYVDTNNSTNISVFYHGNPNTSGIAGLADGQWHNMTVTYSGGTQSTYVDGVARLVVPGLIQSGFASSYYYYLGAGKADGWAFAGPAYFTGEIASFKVWTSALSAGAVTAEFDNTKGRFVP